MATPRTFERRGFGLGELELQLADVETHLDGAECSASLTVNEIDCLRSEYGAVQQRYVSKLTEHEIALLGAQILDIELRLKELRALGSA